MKLMNNKLPLHIGIIMDGNGRYAQKFGKPRSWGHQEGAKNLKKLTKYIFKKNIKYLSVYAFSTENFKRPKEEVDYLMNLFISMFTHDFTFLLKENVKVVFSGRKKDLPLKVIKAMHEMEEKSKNNTSATFNVCLNYGAQDEMVDAVYKISQKDKPALDDVKDTILDNLTDEALSETNASIIYWAGLREKYNMVIHDDTIKNDYNAIMNQYQKGA